MTQPTPQNQLKSQAGWRRIIKAFDYAKDGFQAAFQHEAAFRQLLALHGFLLILLMFCDFDTPIKMLLFAASMVSLIVELLNTGLEAIVDDISLTHRPLAKRAKDVGAAAQLLSLILLTILWFWAFQAA